MWTLFFIFSSVIVGTCNITSTCIYFFGKRNNTYARRLFKRTYTIYRSHITLLCCIILWCASLARLFRSIYVRIDIICIYNSISYILYYIRICLYPYGQKKKINKKWLYIFGVTVARYNIYLCIILYTRIIGIIYIILKYEYI